MSLIITIHCSEGIVMASDSRITYKHTETLTAPKEGLPPVIVKENGVHFTDTTYKTFLTSKGIGVSTCGCSSVEGKPITGMIEEFLFKNEDLNISDLATGLREHFSKLIPKESVEFIVAGYAQNEEGMNQIICRIDTLNPNIETIDTTCHGALWSGETDIISRLTSELYLRRVQPDGSEKHILHAGSPILWNFFTLQDCIDFAEYAIKTTIDTMRFQRRVKTVGGPIDILVIKPSGAQWVSHKELHASN